MLEMAAESLASSARFVSRYGYWACYYFCFWLSKYLDILHNKGLIRLVKTMGGGVDITEITTQGKRVVRNSGAP